MSEPPLVPTHYEGKRVAWCPCGQPLELTADPPHDRYAIRCSNCIKFVLVEDQNKKK